MYDALEYGLKHTANTKQNCLGFGKRLLLSIPKELREIPFEQFDFSRFIHSFFTSDLPINGKSFTELAENTKANYVATAKQVIHHIKQAGLNVEDA